MEKNNLIFISALIVIFVFLLAGFFSDVKKDLICNEWGGVYYPGEKICINMSSAGYCVMDNKLYKSNAPTISRDFVINNSKELNIELKPGVVLKEITASNGTVYKCEVEK